ncbi:Neutral/alkaline non-lysosomal ceramidase [Maioricimonas rarisocia]|uniref:Neutral/alkaline non-lysosomal ceramidase n=1 Tax=Maioricimonas rarisocia TaxID=2528026 RepID=A0A517Z4E7_9PLAN|nr:neutral/alkaline non-lysosomal ceramidase N-terminal domain-containing protein [Maioricimonas rarisocia]QDU37358.1 Neutral/alkaline non-lysosomal ceramidase [Maioricimonas rarisocia]
MHRRWFVLGVVTLGMSLLAVGKAADAGWQAGGARLNITPGQSMWMSGYGGRDHPSEGKLTELWAKVLVLQDDAGTRLAVVTLDLVGLDRATEQAIRSQVAEQYGIPVANTALFSSHTHTGPVVGTNLKAMYAISDEQWQLVDEYTSNLIRDVVAKVGEAIDDLEPAEISWGNGTATFAVNRRNNRAADVPKLREMGQLRGPVDHDVPVLAVRTEEKLKAVLFGYACHATVLSFYQWSGDYPGFAQIAVEEAHPGCLAMFWAGCGADQNPLPRRTVELATEYGKRLGQAVSRVLEGDMQPIGGEIAAVSEEVPLEFAELPSREQLLETTKSSNRFEAGRARWLLGQWEANDGLSGAYPYPVQSWKLGDGPLWVILGGEVVVDYSLRFKNELGADTTWVAGYANDVMAYIPSLRVLREGGYEGATSMIYYGQPSVWAEGIESRIASEVQRQADIVRKASTKPQAP